MAKLFLGLGNQMTARFNDIDNMIRLNTEKVSELEKKPVGAEGRNKKNAGEKVTLYFQFNFDNL